MSDELLDIIDIWVQFMKVYSNPKSLFHCVDLSRDSQVSRSSLRLEFCMRERVSLPS